MARVSAATAPLLAEYSARCGRPCVAAIDDVFTIAGLPDSRRKGRAARDTRTIPTTLILSTRSHSSSSLSATVPAAPTPALLTTTSIPPSSRAAAATASSTDARSPMSQVNPATPSGRPPGRRSSTATRAPRAVRAAVTAAPIPEAPPVTRARTPAKESIVNVLVSPGRVENQQSLAGGGTLSPESSCENASAKRW